MKKILLSTLAALGLTAALVFAYDPLAFRDPRGGGYGFFYSGGDTTIDFGFYAKYVTVYAASGSVECRVVGAADTLLARSRTSVVSAVVNPRGGEARVSYALFPLAAGQQYNYGPSDGRLYFGIELANVEDSVWVAVD